MNKDSLSSTEGHESDTQQYRATIAMLLQRATVTVPMAGMILGIDRSSAYAAAKGGDIPTIRIGRRLLVPTRPLLLLLGLDAPYLSHVTTCEPGDWSGSGQDEDGAS